MIKRIEFVHPSGYFDGGCEHQKWIAYTVSEVREQFLSFLNNLFPKNIYGVNEYTTSKELPGDDKVTHFVAYYFDYNCESAVKVQLNINGEAVEHEA